MNEDVKIHRVHLDTIKCVGCKELSLRLQICNRVNFEISEP